MGSKSSLEKSYLISSKKQIAISKKGQLFINGLQDEDETTGEQAKTKAIELTAKFYNSFLQNHFENLIILSGAGSSMDHPDETYPKLGGKSVGQLWSSVQSSLGDDYEGFLGEVKYSIPEGDIGNIEDLLSQARLATQFSEESEKIQTGINTIEGEIVKQCNLTLPENSPHENLLRSITARKLKLPRAKVFTLNYDTLFEQAAIKGAYSVIDGFSFSTPHTFNGKYFDHDIVVRENSRVEKEENYLPRVFHFYKLHGSLNWEKNSDGEIIKKDTSLEKPVLIYPRNDKFEVSYEQPFFEMIARFQSSVREKNSLLICIGFSFYDKHIKSIILEAVRSNPSFQLLVVIPDIDIEPDNDHSSLVDLAKEAKTSPNVTLVSDYFHTFAKNLPYSPNYTSELERAKGDS